MNDDDLPDDVERIARKLEESLGHDPHREPAEDRVAAVRAAAERMRRSAGPDSSVAGHQTVTRLPRRRALLLGGVAASVGGVLGFGARALTDDDETLPTGPPTEPIAFSGAPSRVRADARLVNHTWGTELLLDVSGLRAGRTYDVVYHLTDGSRTHAGSFLAVANTLMKCRFNAAALRDQMASISVEDERGREAMRASLA